MKLLPTKRDIRFWWQRRTRGWSDDETWNLDHTCAKFILPRLKRFKKLNNGFPGGMSEKEWNEKLDKMILGMEIIIDEWNYDSNYQDTHENNLKMTKGTKLFGEYYRDLWWFILPIFLSGCAISPIPKDIKAHHEKVLQIVPQLESVLQEGDIIFRLGRTIVAGSVDFSELVAQLSKSDFSHAVLVYKITDEGIIVADVSTLGVERQFLQDWLMRGSENIVVKRLFPQYQYVLPQMMKELQVIIEQDSLYDESFATADEFYCVEVVDHCFRKAGLPLADRVHIKDLPGFNSKRIIVFAAEILTDVNIKTKVAIAGNDEIGLFSSPYLETILDLRNNE